MLAPLAKHVFIETTPQRRGRPRRAPRNGRVPANPPSRNRRRGAAGLPF